MHIRLSEACALRTLRKVGMGPDRKKLPAMKKWAWRQMSTDYLGGSVEEGGVFRVYKREAGLYPLGR